MSVLTGDVFRLRTTSAAELGVYGPSVVVINMVNTARVRRPLQEIVPVLQKKKKP